ncbi:hypothetical protein D3C87_1537370 [compost metagenome]
MMLTEPPALTVVPWLLLWALWTSACWLPPPMLTVALMIDPPPLLLPGLPVAELLTGGLPWPCNALTAPTEFAAAMPACTAYSAADLPSPLSIARAAFSAACAACTE